MEKFRNFAIKRPFLFGLILIFIYSLLGALTYPVHYLFPQSEAGQLYGDALGKFLIFLVFLYILWRFGWLKASRITNFGDIWVWLIIVPILVYKVLTWLYAFTGDLSISFTNRQIAVANLIFPLQTSLVEETMFRGLVLTAMIIAWGETRNGQIKAVILSSTYFGLIHMLNVIIRPFGVVFVQAIIVALPGILYAAIVLTYQSMWPVIAIHWLTNAAINIKLIGHETYQETLLMWGISAAFMIPLIIFSLYLIGKLPENYRYENLGVTLPATNPC